MGARHLGERIVLGQEPVAGVDRLATRDQRGRKDGRCGEIRTTRLGRSNTDRLVGQLDSTRIAVGLAVGDNRRDAQTPARAKDAQSDLASIGDEDLVEHQAARIRIGLDGKGRLRSDWRCVDTGNGLAVFDRLAGLDIQ